MAENRGSYETVTLRHGNINQVAAMTGFKKHDLLLLLKKAQAKGKYEVKVPIGVKLFTRDER